MYVQNNIIQLTSAFIVFGVKHVRLFSDHKNLIYCSKSVFVDKRF